MCFCLSVTIYNDYSQKTSDCDRRNPFFWHVNFLLESQRHRIAAHESHLGNLLAEAGNQRLEVGGFRQEAGVCRLHSPFFIPILSILSIILPKVTVFAAMRRV